MAVRIAVNREVPWAGGILVPGYEYTVTEDEAHRLRHVGALAEPRIEERTVSAPERTAQLIPDETIEEIARGATTRARVNRMARGATATR